MKKIILMLVISVTFAFSGDIEISNSFVKIVPPNMKQTAIFMDIKNKGDKEVKLIKAETSLSDITELHTHLKENGMMKMVQVKDISIPANSTVNLKPGSLHIMVFDLKKHIDENTVADITLEFDNGETIKLNNISAKTFKKMDMHNH